MANWPAARSYAFHQLLIARAIENQSYVVASNRVGIDGKGTNHQGDSTIIDFKGKHIIEMEANKEGSETINLNYNQLSTFRDSFTVGMDWDDFNFRSHTSNSLFQTEIFRFSKIDLSFFKKD